MKSNVVNIKESEKGGEEEGDLERRKGKVTLKQTQNWKALWSDGIKKGRKATTKLWWSKYNEPNSLWRKEIETNFEWSKEPKQSVEAGRQLRLSLPEITLCRALEEKIFVVFVIKPNWYPYKAWIYLPFKLFTIDVKKKQSSGKALPSGCIK